MRGNYVRAPGRSPPDMPASSPAAVVYQYPKLVACTLLRRYKRFLADVAPVAGSQPRAARPGAAPADAAAPTSSTDGAAAAGSPTVVHCPNTGPMSGLLDRLPCPALCSVSDAKGRKYAMTLELVQPEPGGVWVGVHSALANKMAAHLLHQRLLPQLGDYVDVQPEVRLGSNWRVDFMLTRASGARCYVEVKSVTLAQPLQQEQQEQQQQLAPPVEQPRGSPQQPRQQVALFPDTVSKRALQHVEELTRAVAQGHEAACLFVVQRADCAAFAPCYAKDPQYALATAAAAAAGVRMIAAVCAAAPAAGAGDDAAVGVGVRFLGTLPVLLDHGSASVVARAAAPPRGQQRGRKRPPPDQR